jgi:hypothetical protein
MNFAKKIEAFFFPCQAKIDAMLFEYNDALDKFKHNAEEAKNTVIRTATAKNGKVHATANKKN